MACLLIRTDDAASSSGANAGIVESIDAGLARNVSVMAVGPAFESAAASLLPHRRGVCFGLHLVLTSEWEAIRWGPLTDPDAVPALVEADGSFPRLGETVNDRAVPADQVMTELTAQYERAIAAGFDIAYVDEHMGIGWAAGVRAVITQFCKKRDLIVADALPLRHVGCCLRE
jgi:chitin disaccharide deacetylase